MKPFKIDKNKNKNENKNENKKYVSNKFCDLIAIQILM